MSLIVSVELLRFGYSVITVVDADEGRYETASHELVRDLLEPGERLAGDGRTFWANTNQITGHDDVRGTSSTRPAGGRSSRKSNPVPSEPGHDHQPLVRARCRCIASSARCTCRRPVGRFTETPVRGEVFETPRSDVVGGTHGQMVLEGRTEIEIEIPVAGLRGCRSISTTPVDLRTAGRGR